MRRRIAALAVVLAALGAACGPSAGPSPSNGKWYQWSRDAIDVEFARYGPHVVDCAHRIADRESGHWPFSDNGDHHGIFQLHDGFWGSIKSAAAQLGRDPNWYDPRQNSRAAMWAFEAHGRSFRANWAGTTPSDCP